jgi:probable F420-dependent oxidoreductase
MKFGVALGRVNPAFFVDVAVEADRLGYESVWLPEHLVFPVHMTRSPFPGEDHPPVPPQTPVFDCFAYLSFLAARTERIHLGTHVYNLALRHPFVAARAVATLDILSGGRAEVGIGVGWLESEWQAAGLDFHRRGARADEALEVCQRLWSEEVVAHHGTFFDFDEVMFEPKPVRKPWPPIHVGGESDAALRRAARAGDGWIGMGHTPESAASAVAKLRAYQEEYGRADRHVEVTLSGDTSPDSIAAFEDAGVDRMIVSPWRRSPEAVEGLRRAAADLGLGS